MPPALSAELVSAIIHYLEPAELLLFTRTSRAWKDYISAQHTRLFDINSLLLDYVDDPDDFRTLLDYTGTLISGSLALQFIGRRFTKAFLPKDMDLYVAEVNAYVVIDWLRFHRYALVYRSCDAISDRIVSTNAIAFSPTEAARHRVGTRPHRRGQAVFKFYDETKHTKIDLIVTLDSPFTAIVDFHTTGLMNFITPRLAVSLYPRGSLLERVFLVSRYDSGRRMQRVLSKYERRGYKITFCTTKSESFTPGNRWLRDHLSTSILTRRSAPWLFDIPFQPQRRSVFWTTRPYQFSQPLSDVPQQGREFWYRNGWRLNVQFEGRDKEERLSMDVQAYSRSSPPDTIVRFPYCVPPLFITFSIERDSWREENLVSMSDDRAIEEDVAMFSSTRVPA